MEHRTLVDLKEEGQHQWDVGESLQSCGHFVTGSGA